MELCWPFSMVTETQNLLQTTFVQFTWFQPPKWFWQYIHVLYWIEELILSSIWFPFFYIEFLENCHSSIGLCNNHRKVRTNQTHLKTFYCTPLIVISHRTASTLFLHLSILYNQLSAHYCHFSKDKLLLSNAQKVGTQIEIGIAYCHFSVN